MSKGNTQSLLGPQFPHFQNLGTLQAGLTTVSFIGGFPEPRTAPGTGQVLSIHVLNETCETGGVVGLNDGTDGGPDSQDTGRCSYGCPGHPCTCPPSAWHKWQQKGEDSTRRAGGAVQSGPAGVTATPIHLCSTPPYPRAFARAHFLCWGRLPAPSPPSHSCPTLHGLHHHLLREALLSYLASCPGVVSRVSGPSDSGPPPLDFHVLLGSLGHGARHLAGTQ